MNTMESAARAAITGLAALLMAAGTGPVVRAQALPADTPRVSLPYEVVDTLDGAKFKLRVPGNWNGTLLVFIPGTKTGPAPPVPRLAPPVLPPSDTSLEETLLSRGYALAGSGVADTDWQLKAAVQDIVALTAYFRAMVGQPKRVIVWGSSLGGLTALRLMEDFPRSFDGAIAMCPPAAGEPRRQDTNLDFNLAYAVVFGWRDEAWGPVGNLKPGLNFASDINPLVDWPKADGSNRGGWEFIRLVNGLASDAFWKTDPGLGAPGFYLRMFLSTWQRSNAQLWASGPVAQNLDHQYWLTPEEKSYLAGLGVEANALLEKMNAQTNTYASPRARDYLARFGDVHGTLAKPVLTLHTTLDTLADIRNENAYRQTVEAANCLQYLVQAYVAGLGHCAFTSDQLLAGLAAMEGWLDSGKPPGAWAFPEALGFDNSFAPAPWPY
ncbi:MAG: prolyl oligopeptidase family serine peptidase [Acidobacteria bacterium]|nr:prolyl oligopeptidase family serine peptidase [Acidobacteriota bacterium]